MAASARPKPGDHVVVPWGLDEVPGTVRDIYGPHRAQFALVTIAIQGTAGETLAEEDVSFPLSEIRVVAAA
jgi:hypothetical protein